MSTDAIAELERLLRTVRFQPPSVLPRFSQALHSLPARPRAESLAIGAAAVICVVLLVFVFWSAVLEMRG